MLFKLLFKIKIFLNFKMEKYNSLDYSKKRKKYHYKVLDNFKKELMKQLYKDLFELNKDLYTKENITYEFFLFEFYSLVEQNIDFDNPDYPGLLFKINDIIKEKILANKQNREMNEEVEDLYQNAEWDLIEKYKTSLEMEQKMNERKEKVEKMKKYNDELTQQIELNKILKNKNNIENEQKIEKQDKYLLDEKVAKKELQEMKIKESKDKDINKKEKEKEENFDYNNLEGMDKDEMITMMVNKIMNEKRAQKIDNILNGIKSKYYNEEKEFIMPDIKYDQKKVDQIIEKEMQKYQDI